MPLETPAEAPAAGAKEGIGAKLRKLPEALKKYRTPALILGGTAAGLGAIGYHSRAKERAREEAVVQGILQRNLQKSAGLTKVALPFMPFMRALGSGLKSVAGGVAGGLGKGVGAMSKGFENAGFKGVANGINTMAGDVSKAGQWAMQRGGQIGNWAMNRGRQLGTWAGNTRAGQWAMNKGQGVANRVKNWFGPANPATPA